MFGLVRQVLSFHSTSHIYTAFERSDLFMKLPDNTIHCFSKDIKCMREPVAFGPNRLLINKA
jgi:hypothetical protein